MLSTKHWIHCLGYLIGGLFALSGVGFGHTPDSCLEAPFSFSLAAPASLQNWEDGWKNNAGQTVTLPQVLDWEETGVFKRTFDLDCDPGDTIFIVIEGLAWNAELELNHAFLATHSHPLQTMVVPLPAGLILPRNNQLTIRVYKGELVDFSPKRFVGFLGPAWLMDSSQVRLFFEDKKAGSNLEPGGLAALVGWEPSCGFCFDPGSIAKKLVAARQNNINNIYLPVFAHRDLVAFCRDAGFNIVDRVDNSKPLIWLNSFPYEAASFRYRPAFWLDEQDNRTQAFGVRPEDASGNLPWALVLLGLTPLFIIAAMRIISPMAYRGLWASWRAPARGMDIWFDNLVSNAGLNTLITLFRLVQGASLFALWVWVLRAEGLISWFNVFKDWSILSRLFYSIEHPLALFGRAFFLYGGVVLLLFFVNTFLGRVFKRKDFPLAVTASENLAAFPVWWLLGASLVLAAILDLPFRYLALALLLLFFGWRVFIFYFNAEKRLGITGGVKYLYICASIFPIFYYSDSVAGAIT
ncbi:MAG: hypothetical protein R3B47_02040 [Bacteroidia bacterium]